MQVKHIFFVRIFAKGTDDGQTIVKLGDFAKQQRNVSVAVDTNTITKQQNTYAA